MRVVLDTNVLLSAAFFPGVCEKILARCIITPTIQIILSSHILQEFDEHGTGKLNGSAAEVEAFAAELRRHAMMVEPATVPASAFADPDDLPVLGTAIAGNAELIVTGDKSLLALGRYQGVVLLSPRTFYSRIQ